LTTIFFMTLGSIAPFGRSAMRLNAAPITLHLVKRARVGL
jgi:hypothetical protein